MQIPLHSTTPIESLVDAVERGEEVTITRDGAPVARLVPAPPDFDREKAQAAAEGLRRASRGLRLDGLAIKDLIDQGRA